MVTEWPTPTPTTTSQESDMGLYGPSPSLAELVYHILSYWEHVTITLGLRFV